MKQLSLFLIALFSFIFTLLLLPAVSAAHGEAQWAKFQLGDNESDYYGVATDSAGNTYVVGDLGGPGITDFGNGVTIELPTTYWSAIIVKYNAAGTAQWAKFIDSPWQNTYYTDIAVTPDGQSLYVVGSMGRNYACDFGNGVTVSGSYAYGNPIIVKYNTDGVAQWARSTASSAYSSHFSSVSTDGVHGVVATSEFYTGYAFNFGNGVSFTPGGGGGQLGIIKYDNDGTPLWGKTVLSAPYNTTVHDILMLDSGDVLAVGRQVGGGVSELGDGVQISSPTTPAGHAYLVKYNSAGVPQWASSVIAGQSSTFRGVDVDGSGNLYTVGDMDGFNMVDFGNGIQLQPPPGGAGNVPIAVKFNNSGVAQWAHSVSVMDYIYAELYDVKVSGDYIYAVGFSNEGSIDFGNSVVANFTATNGGNILFSAYHKDTGTPLFARTALSSTYEGYLESASVDTSGNVYMVGYFESAVPIDFGNSVVAGPSTINWHGGLIKYRGFVLPPTPTPSPSPVPTAKPVVYIEPSVSPLLSPTPTPTEVMMTITPSTMPPTSREVEIVDEQGKPIKGAVILLDGITYTSSQSGTILLPSNRSYETSTISVTNNGVTVLGVYKNGKIVAQSADVKTKSDNTVVLFLGGMLIILIIATFVIISRKK